MKKVRYIIECKDGPRDFWSILRRCDTKKEALDICKYKIAHRKEVAARHGDTSHLANFYRVLKEVQEVIFTEKEEVFE